MEQNGTPAGEEELILALAAGATVREADFWLRSSQK
jgi:hypothetical protein